MKVLLKHASNPDLNYGYWEPPIDSPQDRYVHVQTFREASRVCTRYIERNGLGGGNWTGGQIYNDLDQQIAYVSYNGRVWEGTEYSPDNKEITLEAR